MPYDASTLQVADLVDRPGASRRVALRLAAPEDLDLPLAEVIEPLRFDGVLESVVDGLLIRGKVGMRVALSCARCLGDVQADISTDVVELFSDPAEAEDAGDVEEGYELVDGRVDLDTLLRDALAPAVPYQPLCDAACRGLCPDCGVNRNEVTCSCEETTPDARWTALQQLDLPDDGSDRSSGS